MILRVLTVVVVPAVASDVDALIGIGSGVATVIGLTIDRFLLIVLGRLITRFRL